MIVFDMAKIKAEMKEAIDNMQDYGHPSYSQFHAEFSKCGKYEMFLDVEPRPMGAYSRKFGFLVEVRILSLQENLTEEDLESDSYHDEVLTVLDPQRANTRADLWSWVATAIRNANEKDKELKANK